MKRFFRTHYEKFLVLFAIIFLLALIGFYIWVAQLLMVSFNKTTDINVRGGEETHFDIKGASALGIGQQ
jgi:flagellar biogenesis protein FliO